MNNAPARQETHTNGVSLPSDQQQHRVGQGTAVEQSRAAAEVQAAIFVAQQCPRDMQKALGMMRESCAQPRLADHAFFRFSRAGQQITGPTVHLARELARCWGNIQYGVVELRRDDTYGQSEMQAYAWDVETNTRVATVFIVPHKRDKKDKKTGKPAPEAIVEMRDLYENNSNAGARRVRECIFNVLPPWFTEEAQDICRHTIENGSSGKTLPQRISQAVDMFAEQGITTEQLEDKLGRGKQKWSAHDVTQLGVIYQSIQRGEVNRDDEFPPQRVTADEITRGRTQPTPADDDGEQGLRDDDPDLQPQDDA